MNYPGGSAWVDVLICVAVSDSFEEHEPGLSWGGRLSYPFNKMKI